MLEPAIARMLATGDQHIAIAGAGGWIGLATLDLLEQALGDTLAQRVSCYGSAARMLTLRSGRQVPQASLSEIKRLTAPRIWLLHLAFLTKDRAESLDEDAYRAANESISAMVLEAARTLPVEAMFIASSGAATKAEDPLASPAMRLYGQMKRDDEGRFSAWAQQAGRRMVIGRIFNITGPYINKHQAYAIANFINDALAQRPITVQAPREVFRAYVALRELVLLVFALMATDSALVTRFDSGGQAMELGDVAQAVADALGGDRVERAVITDPVPDHYVGDGAAYATLLAQHGIEPVSLAQQIVETADYMSNAAG